MELGESGGEGGIRTPGTSFSSYNGLANRRLQPLGHLSGVCLISLTQFAHFLGSSRCLDAAAISVEGRGDTEAAQPTRVKWFGM